MILNKTGVCISLPTALCLAPGSGLGPQLWHPICVYWPWSPICIYRHWLRICIYQSWSPIDIYQPGRPSCIYQPWHPICIYQPWPLIYIYWPWLPSCIYRHWPTVLLPVRDVSLHIPTWSPQSVFVFTALAYDLNCRSGALICIYFIVVAMVVIIEAISIVPLYLCRF